MTRSIFTTVTPLPAGIPRYIVKECLHDHYLMIDLNPLVIKREKMSKPYNKATPEEFNCNWYEITDRISYFPGVKGQVTYYGAFHDLENGLQTHVYAPMGLDIRSKWTVGGNEPGEPRETRELGINAPSEGLYLREDVDLSVTRMMLGFVKKNLVNAHKELMARMVERTKKIDNALYNARLQRGMSQAYAQSNHSARSFSSNGPTQSSTQVPSAVPSSQEYASPRQSYANVSQDYTSSRQSYANVSQGYPSPTQQHFDERHGSHAFGWHAQNTGLHPSHAASPTPPYDRRSGYPSDQKYTYAAPAQQPDTHQDQGSEPQELSTERERPPAELE